MSQIAGSFNQQSRKSFSQVATSCGHPSSRIQTATVSWSSSAASSRSSNRTDLRSPDWQQHVLLETGSFQSVSAHGAAALRHARNLSSLIKQCEAWQQLAGLVEDHRESFNYINVSAALTRIAQLYKNQPDEAKWPATEEQQRFMNELLLLASGCSHQFSSRQVANVMWALSRIGTTECVTLMQQLMPHAMSLMPWFEPQHLSNCLWAIARAGVVVDDGFMEAFLMASETAMRNFEPQHLSNVMWALARMGITPDMEWIAVYMDQVRRRLADFTPRDVSDTLFAAASLGMDLGSTAPDLLEGLQRQVLRPPPQQLPSPAAAMTPGAQSGAGHRSTGKPAGGTTSGNASLEAGPQVLAHCMWALATMSAVPPKAWMDQVWARVEAQLPAFDPQALSTLLWSAASLGQPLPPTLMQAVYARTEAVLGEFQAQSLSNLIWAMATSSAARQNVLSSAHATSATTTTSLAPPKQWVRAFLAAVSGRLPEFEEQATSNVMWSLARLKVTPEPSWAAAMVAHVHMRLPSIGPQALSNMLWALAKMGYSLNVDAAALVVGMVRARLAQDTAEVEEHHSQAAHTADYFDITSAHSTNKASSLQGGFRPQELANVLYALAKFGHPLPEDVAQGLMDGLHMYLRASKAMCIAEAEDAASAPWLLVSRLRAQELANSVWALSVLQLSPRAAWLDDFWSACQQQLHTFNARDLAQTVHALAKLRWQPPGSGSVRETNGAAQCTSHKHSEGCASVGLGGTDELPALPSIQETAMMFAAESLRETGSSTAPSSRSTSDPLVSQPPTWARRFLAESHAALPKCSSQDLSNLSWGLAQLGVQPGQGWCEGLADALVRQADTCPGHHLAITVWALGKLGHRPKPRSLFPVEAALFSRMPSLKPRELAATIWAFSAMMGADSSAQGSSASSTPMTVASKPNGRTGSKDAADSRTAGNKNGSASSAVGSVAVAVPRADRDGGYTLSVEWLEAFANQCMLMAAQFSQQDWAVVVYSLASIVETNKSAAIYLEDLFISPQLESQIHAFGPSSVAMMTYACGMLGTRSARLMGRLLRAAKAHMAQFSATELSGIICACAKLGHAPDAGFLSAWYAEVEARMPSLSGSVLACCTWALATIKAGPPPEPWMRTLCLVLPQRMGALSAQEVAMLAWALGELRYTVPEPVLSSLTERLEASRHLYDRSTRKVTKAALSSLAARARRAARNGIGSNAVASPAKADVTPLSSGAQ